MKNVQFLAKTLSRVGTTTSQATALLYSKILLLLLFTTVLSACEEELNNPAPTGTTITAKAGDDKTVEVGQTATLDASASTESENRTLYYSWAILQKPEGSQAVITSPTQVRPTFVADLPGVYQIELTASSAGGQSKDQLTLTAVTGTGGAGGEGETATILN
ncbi:PKD domain-containing protein [Pontibacter sp. SGAir0037]|uniref:PKD domain-containing protein n=1 Tax=Pontibacter sp. SGAir0037 TaxID=2571030 RepID=UPI0010CD2E85|nr:PKD domain-containing protein [Pontibacter sp. SGAir0037]QCR22494.1 hypothetical protein C1N53_09200 [Pontibacter sp. SGAir0037]